MIPTITIASLISTRADEKITLLEALIAAGSGAVTGAAAASGLGLASMVGEGAKQGMNGEFYEEDLLMSGAGGAISGLAGGRGMGKYANLKTLNKNLTKKLFSGSVKTFKKGLKYYVSQTRTVYRHRLQKPLGYSGFASLIFYRGKSLYYRWRH